MVIERFEPGQFKGLCFKYEFLFFCRFPKMGMAKERHMNENENKHTATDFFVMVVQVGDQSATEVISRIKRPVVIRLVMTDELDCFSDAFEKSGSILIRLGVAMQLFHLDSDLARFCREKKKKRLS